MSDDYWSAEYKAALIEDLNDALDNAATLRKRADDLERLLLDLTPGGSEFSSSPERCAAWVQARLSSTGKLAAERNKLRAKGVLLAVALETLMNIAEDAYAEAGQTIAYDPHGLGVDAQYAAVEASDKIFAALKQGHNALARWQDKEATE